MRSALIAAAVAAFAEQALVGSALADAPTVQAPGIVVKRDIAYGPLAEQTLTTCAPTGSDGKSRPGVVLIHGGGWVALDKNDLMPICEALARDGLFAATIDYRLVKKTEPTTRWPAQLADAQLAVRWLRAHQAELKLDGQRLCAYGESAGGQLAVFLAAKKTIEPSDMAHRLADQPVAVSCAVDNFGPVDLADPGPLKDNVQLLLGKTLNRRNLAAFREASPLYLVNHGTAPIYIEQGTGDTTVRPVQSFKLFAALNKNFVPARFETYPGGHGWKGVPPFERAFLADEERQFLRLFLTFEPNRTKAAD